MRKLSLILGVILLSSTIVFAQKTIKEKCQKSYDNCVSTRKAVVDLINQAKKLKQTEYVKAQVSDAEFWLKKADKLLEKTKARMDKGEYNQDVLTKLGFVWQWYVKAASSAVRAIHNQTVKMKK